MRTSELTLDSVLNAIAERVAARLQGPASSASGQVSRLLTVEQASVYLSRSEQGIRHLIRAGKIPVVKIDGKVQIDRRDLDGLIERAKTA